MYGIEDIGLDGNINFVKFKFDFNNSIFQTDEAIDVRLVVQIKYLSSTTFV